jgi:endo-1,4-beta-D-glucanase Y
MPITALNRRALLGGLAVSGTTALSLTEPVLPAKEWHLFKTRFLSADGRIIDNASGDVSHSEGQGWGMLFATAANDQASFDLILNWTVRMLRRPGDALHAWRFVPKDQPPVQDLNNAVDGDLFIAAALIRAGRQWRRPDYLHAAAAVARDILRLSLRQVGPFTVLLPGLQGFETADAIIVNPSYYAFPMMNALAKIVPSTQWDQLQSDGRTLIEQGRFGHWSLPPDWLRIAKTNAALSPAAGWAPRFSFDAVRVPLWWSWGKLPVGPAIRSVEQFWSSLLPTFPPAWVDLQTNEVAPYAATPGMRSILRLMRLAAGGPREADLPSIAGEQKYYDAALILLSQLAEQDIMPH